MRTGNGAGAPGLEVERLRVTFGGNVAVADASLAAPVGRITGLIGPNGAGKTTTLNACTGLVRPSAGRVLLFGADVTGSRPSARARAGLGRTFQTPEVCAAMTVRENVAIGLEARWSGANPLRQLATGPGRRRAVADEVDEALRACGIAELADRAAAVLSAGQQRLVELARAVAGGFELLLLDEPSSGLDEGETVRFGGILERIVAGGRRGILLVEHDISLVMAVCDSIYVLDFGEMIFAGTPDETRASPVVRAAYLGPDRDEARAAPAARRRR
ncbi:MAG: hypothetical protein QOG43_1194 [Actinomycetota bacterium]|nr:hypothetical protein [Actinomycetota bacterium]